jgi:hypothetical protein
MKESEVELIDWIIGDISQGIARESREVKGGSWNPWHDKGDRVNSGAMGVQDIHRLYKSKNARR